MVVALSTSFSAVSISAAVGLAGLLGWAIGGWMARASVRLNSQLGTDPLAGGGSLAGRNEIASSRSGPVCGTCGSSRCN